MAEWRFGRGWSERELEERLHDLETRGRNFSEPIDELTSKHGWRQFYSEAVIVQGHAHPSPDEDLFERAKSILRNFEFSDRRIVTMHYLPSGPLLGRRMLLEIRPLRLLHYLSGVVVGDVFSEQHPDRTVYGLRYETLEGHLECGAEWFRLIREHETGRIRFRIDALWKPGQFPNWWSRLGFAALAPIYQELWHRYAHTIMARQVNHPELRRPNSRHGLLIHTNPEVTFKRLKAEKDYV